MRQTYDDRVFVLIYDRPRKLCLFAQFGRLPLITVF